MPLHQCSVPTGDGRRHFWATQPSACGTFDECRSECGIPGLVLKSTDDGKTFATDEWVRSLLLNIFNTVARKDPTVCGNLPGMQGGHWSESYAEGSTPYVGTKMYYNSAPAKTFREALALLNAAIASDAHKLVAYGVASSVNIETKYLGDNLVSVIVWVIGPDITEGKVNLKVKRLDNAWVWES